MPELPEVEVIVRELRPRLTGKVIESAVVLWPKTFLNYHSVNLCGQKIFDVNRHGKFIIFNLDDGYIFTHLRMTGKYIFNNRDQQSEKHLRVYFNFKENARLYFYDARKFGRIVFTDHPPDVLSNFGIDALDDSLDSERFFKLMKQKKQGVKAFLLDQKNISGMGNIYTDEALFKSGIHPLQETAAISKRKSAELFTTMRSTLQLAIENMGTTISDYRTTGGGFGSNQHFLQVYGRSGESCFKCGREIKKIKAAGRGTHFCPRCQKLKRARV